MDAQDMALQLTASNATTNVDMISRLPTELQLEILRYCLVVDSDIDDRSEVTLVPDLLRIALVSHHFRDVAYAVYYGENKFEVMEAPRYIHGKAIRLLHFPKPEVAQYIRHLDISLTHRSSAG